MNKSLLLSFSLLLPLFSCAAPSSSDEAEAEKVTYSYASGELKVCFPSQGFSSFRIYEIPRKGSEFILGTVSENNFSTKDYDARFRVVPMEGKGERTDKAIRDISYFDHCFESSSIHIFSPKDNANVVQSTVDRTYDALRGEEWSSQRCAMFFLPGNYAGVDLKLGYYTSLHGLGRHPDQTQFHSLKVQNHPNTGNALINFWRTAENLSFFDPSLWAVSQATSLRRTRFYSSLALSDYTEGGNNWSSGGFIANSQIDGPIYPGSQQQWLLRNSDCASFEGANMNMVFEGSKGRFPEGDFGLVKTTNLPKTEIMIEKPFLTFDEEKGFGIYRSPIKKNSLGPNLEEALDFIPLSDFYIAHPEQDTASTLNDALNQGKHLFFTPGTYALEEPIRIINDGTLLYGCGLATLRTEKEATSALQSDGAEGITLAGLIFETGNMVTQSMVTLGKRDRSKKAEGRFNLLSDVFFRVGGAEEKPVRAESCLTINADHTILDNLWVWRADHGRNVGFSNNPCPNGITINGSDVHAHGLMVEHFLGYQTIWNGDGGSTVFYQSETPYDVPSQSDWMSGPDVETDLGYASYKIGEQVTSHKGFGLGVYWVNTVPTERYAYSAVSCPEKEGVQLRHVVRRHFAGQGNILNTVNNVTGVEDEYGNAYIEEYPAETA